MKMKAEEDFVSLMSGTARRNGLGEVASQIVATLYLEPQEMCLEEIARRTGYSNIPVKDVKANYVGMFQYKPSRHDNMDKTIPIRQLLARNGENKHRTCSSKMTDDDIKRYLNDNSLRFMT